MGLNHRFIFCTPDFQEIFVPYDSLDFYVRNFWDFHVISKFWFTFFISGLPPFWNVLWSISVLWYILTLWIIKNVKSIPFFNMIYVFHVISLKKINGCLYIQLVYYIVFRFFCQYFAFEIHNNNNLNTTYPFSSK